MSEKITPEVISVYTKAQALDDGILVDISDTTEAKEAGFKAPVVVTRHLWNTIEAGLTTVGQDLKGRLWDLCFMAATAFRNYRKDKHLVPFEVLMRDGENKQHLLKLWLTFSEVDGFCIMYPEDY